MRKTRGWIRMCLRSPYVSFCRTVAEDVSGLREFLPLHKFPQTYAMPVSCVEFGLRYLPSQPSRRLFSYSSMSPPHPVVHFSFDSRSKIF